MSRPGLVDEVAIFPTRVWEPGSTIELEDGTVRQLWYSRETTNEDHVRRRDWIGAQRERRRGQ